MVEFNILKTNKTTACPHDIFFWIKLKYSKVFVRFNFNYAIRTPGGHCQSMKTINARGTLSH